MRAVINFGGGLNGTAVVTRKVRTGDRPDFIVFADTGGERPETYAHLDAMDAWLASYEMAPIVRVRGIRNIRNIRTLEQECLETSTMPGIAYGMKSCSMQWKREPIEKWENNEPALTPHKGRPRAADERITKILGFDLDELRRATKKEDERYVYEYPLIAWGWGRDECAEEVARCGLEIPPKSSCFFCPNMEPHEIMALPPDLLARALEIERRALTARSADVAVGDKIISTIAGLGRDFSWASLIAQQDLFRAPARDRSAPCDCYDGEAA